MGTAEKVGKRKTNPSGATQQAYKLTPPLEKSKYVVVSALASAFDTSSPETFIFPSDRDGKITSFGEIGASQRGTTSHAKVLKESGYSIV